MLGASARRAVAGLLVVIEFLLLMRSKYVDRVFWVRYVNRGGGVALDTAPISAALLNASRTMGVGDNSHGGAIDWLSESGGERSSRHNEDLDRPDSGLLTQRRLATDAIGVFPGSRLFMDVSLAGSDVDL